MVPFPVIGEIDAEYDWLGTGYGRFEVGPIHGLARVVAGNHVELLAIWSYDPGQGHFGRLLQRLKEAYQSVTVLEISNEALEDYLIRQGFQRQEFAGTGITVRWDRAA